MHTEETMPRGLIIHTGRASAVGGIDAGREALHEHVEIKCFYEGSSTLLIGSKTVTASAGDIVVINPYEFHATVANGVEKGRYHLFMVSLDFFSGPDAAELDLRTSLLAKNRSFQTLFCGNKPMHDLLLAAARECEEKKTAFDVAIYGLMTQFFALLLREGLEKKEESAPRGELLRSYQLIEPALRHIRDTYKRPITVDALAALCGVSKHYFCRVFKAVTAKTSMEYVRDYRLKVADTLLANTQKSVTAVAEECGFESANYFCRCYKKQFGISPNKR